ncbi:ATP-binding cassette domain-containing protein [Methanofollis fontis]|uniref:ABC transporter n=1 Tax=Methanofollis fontis TaxID=2052832 RepID=A0A483CWG5_9EURY|nr:ATP-binding cassette domain-containing protein [Methanofollis fontis]TAJ43986.1 ABC transporter [Methanofollis fontis]
MQVRLEGVCARRGRFSLRCTGTFGEGVHLCTGRVGSGKSTLALLLAGLLTPVAGTIRKEGIGSHSLSLQNPEYHVTEPTVGREIASYGVDPADVARSCGLSERMEADPFALSRGELKRLHLACLMAGTYDLLVLDEPFSSLDCIRKRWLCRELLNRRSGVTIIFTHERRFLPHADYLWEVADGEVSCIGTDETGRTR